MCPPAVSHWGRWLLPITGLLALMWFMIRVVPKPSRALYPCQRLAFPLASGFVAWLVGMVTTVVAFRGARRLSRQRHAIAAVACLIVAAIAGMHTLFNVPASPASASTTQDPNAPIGVARGVSPGRVVWVHDPRATNYIGAYKGDGYYWETRHSDQAAIDTMMSVGLRHLTGTNTDAAAWDAIFHNFNNNHGRGDVGYTPGEKINIKVNLVASEDYDDGRVDLSTYIQSRYVENVTVSPQMILALLRQLVYKAGVPQDCISVGDSTCFFVSQHWDLCHPEFPNVQYLDTRGLLGRTKVMPSAHCFYWSNGATAPNVDHVPQVNVDSTYFIDFAVLKAHEGGGISGCGKNYYGSLIRRPGDTRYYELHYDLPFTPATASMGHYRTLTDLMAADDFGYGKGLLWLEDGLWSGDDAVTPPIKWTIPPFNGDWPSSLLISQDPVAIDSVALDACRADMPTWYPGTVLAADDYLHEAALIDNPPSGTFYDPDHDGVRRASLGVHEHWNNNTDRQYSRNLGTGDGIELLWRETGKPGDINLDATVNVGDLQALADSWATHAANATNNWNPDADLNSDGYINIGDLQTLIANWGQ